MLTTFLALYLLCPYFCPVRARKYSTKLNVVVRKVTARAHAAMAKSRKINKNGAKSTDKGAIWFSSLGYSSSHARMLVSFGRIMNCHCFLVFVLFPQCCSWWWWTKKLKLRVIISGKFMKYWCDCCATQLRNEAKQANKQYWHHIGAVRFTCRLSLTDTRPPRQQVRSV